MCTVHAISAPDRQSADHGCRGPWLPVDDLEFAHRFLGSAPRNPVVGPSLRVLNFDEREALLAMSQIIPLLNDG